MFAMSKHSYEYVDYVGLPIKHALPYDCLPSEWRGTWEEEYAYPEFPFKYCLKDFWNGMVSFEDYLRLTILQVYKLNLKLKYIKLKYKILV